MIFTEKKSRIAFSHGFYRQKLKLTRFEDERGADRSSANTKEFEVRTLQVNLFGE